MDNTLQVCFMLDCTASMGDWIEAAKKEILDIFAGLKETYPDYTTQIAFIGYRDVTDRVPMIVEPFTENHEAVVARIRACYPEGGDDICEDVSSAYRTANTLFWSAKVRILFHITDAPNHGLKYHEPNVGDSFPDGVPTLPDLEDEVQALLVLNGVQLTFVQLNDTTAKMTRIMQDIYDDCGGKFNLIKLTKQQQSHAPRAFREMVTMSLMTSLGGSTDPDTP